MSEIITFSIIVPVYNVQNYLRECLNSILDQTYSIYEVLLIDDGSTDNSAAICEEYVKKDQHFRYYYKTNGGLSDARNYGLRKAKGNYLIFIDSDDYIDKNMLRRISDKIRYLPDIITIRMVRVLPDGVIIENDRKLEEDIVQLDTYEKKVQWLIEKSENSWSAVRFIIKRSLLEKSGIHFETGILHEDLDWSARVFMVATSMSFVTEPSYFYRIGRQGSITNVIKAKRITDIFETVGRFCAQEKNGTRQSLKEAIHRELVNSAFRSIQDYPYVKKEEKVLVRKSFINNRQYFYVSNKKSVRVILRISKVLGVNVAFLLMEIAARLKKRKG